jgi:hypothetical protein
VFLIFLFAYSVIHATTRARCWGFSREQNHPLRHAICWFYDWVCTLRYRIIVPNCSPECCFSLGISPGPWVTWESCVRYESHFPSSFPLAQDAFCAYSALEHATGITSQGPPLGNGERDSETKPLLRRCHGPRPQVRITAPERASYQGKVIRVNPDDAKIRVFSVILCHSLESL